MAEEPLETTHLRTHYYTQHTNGGMLIRVEYPTYLEEQHAGTIRDIIDDAIERLDSLDRHTWEERLQARKESD